MEGVAVGGDLLHRHRDGGVVGHIQVEELCNGDFEDTEEFSGAARRPLDQPRQYGFGLAVMAERRGDDRAGEAPVALGKRTPGLVAGDGVEEPVERLPPVEDGGKDVDRDVTNGKARRWRPGL